MPVSVLLYPCTAISPLTIVSSSQVPVNAIIARGLFPVSVSVWSHPSSGIDYGCWGEQRPSAWVIQSSIDHRRVHGHHMAAQQKGTMDTSTRIPLVTAAYGTHKSYPTTIRVSAHLMKLPAGFHELAYCILYKGSLLDQGWIQHHPNWATRLLLAIHGYRRQLSIFQLEHIPTGLPRPDSIVSRARLCRESGQFPIIFSHF